MNKKSTDQLYFFFYSSMIFSCVFVTSCKKENMCDCLKGTGEMITEHRTLADFSQLEVRKNVIVTLVQDTVNYADVEAGENLVALVKTDVSDGTLLITNDNTCNWVRSYKKEIHATVHFKLLTLINHYGSKDITSENFMTGRRIDIHNNQSGDIHAKLHVETSLARLMNGAGDIYLEGSARYSYIFGGSFGFAYAQNFLNDSCQVDHRGTGDIYVSTSAWLGVNLTDVGNIYYTGKPTISATISGSGKLIHE